VPFWVFCGFNFGLSGALDVGSLCDPPRTPPVKNGPARDGAADCRCLATQSCKDCIVQPRVASLRATLGFLEPERQP
jgi:hypothetical protein